MGMSRKKVGLGIAVLVVSAVLGATVLREPIATAASPFQSVIIANSDTQPVPVKQQGSIALTGTANVNVTNSSLRVTTEEEPYEHTTFFNQTATTCTQFVCTVSFPAVPAGKRLVITYASARWALTAGGSGATAEVGVNGNDLSDPQILLPAAVQSGATNYVAAGPVTFYAEAGDVPTLSLQGQFVQPVSNTAEAAIVGHLVTVP